MTEAEWLASTDPSPMLEFLWEKTSERKIRLYVCGCCRRIWDLLIDARSRNVVEVAEQYADAQTDEDDLHDAYWLASAAVPGEDVTTTQEWLRLVLRPDVSPIYEAASCASICALDGDWLCDHVCDASKWHQPGFLVDVFGNPFRPSPPLSPTVLAWNDGTIPRLAEAIYEDRRMPEGTLDTARLAILADALLDAGCDDEALIQHCRSPGPHVRGCWAVDLILGKG